MGNMLFFGEQNQRSVTSRPAAWVIAAFVVQLAGFAFIDGQSAHAASKLTISAARAEGSRIDVGSYHSVALKADGTVAAWGGGYFGESTVPSELTDPLSSNVIAVESGSYHTVALKADGTVLVWGDHPGDPYDQTNVPDELENPVTSRVAAIEAGNYHTAALKEDGTVVEWGYDLDARADYFKVLDGVGDVVAVEAGRYYTVALKKDGTIRTWITGAADQALANMPAILSDPTTSRIAAIAAGESHVLALTEYGTIVAWGDDSHGQSSVPEGLNDVVAVAAGRDYSVALRADGTVVDWGRSQFTAAAGYVPLPEILKDPKSSHVVAITVGFSHAMAVRADGTVVAWGDNSDGQLNVPEGLRMYQYDLQHLEVQVGTSPEQRIHFIPDTVSYTVDDPVVGTDSMNATATLASDDYAIVKVNGRLQASGAVKTIPLQLGSNLVTFDVVDKFFEHYGRTYTVKVTRNATTSDIEHGAVTLSNLSSEVKTGLSGGGINITVVAGQPFRTGIVGFDQIADGANDAGSGITLHNENPTDGYIEISGTLSAPGMHFVTISGVNILVQAIPAPGSSTVHAYFE